MFPNDKSHDPGQATSEKFTFDTVMKLLEILTTLFLSLTLVSSSNLSSKLNSRKVAVSSVPTQTGHHALPASKLHSLLRDAVSKDDPNQVRTLLENHVPSSQDEFDINTIISGEGALLHWAAYRGHSDLVPVLLIHGADIDSKRGTFSMTPLMYAAENGHETIVVLLLNTLAAHPERMYSHITEKDYLGWNALHHAATYGHDAVIVQLLDALATQPKRMQSLITAKIRNGPTALRLACKMHKTNTAKVLLEHYKEALDKIKLNTSSSTAKLPSTCNNFVNLMNQEMSLALDLSITQDCAEIVDLLARFGAKLDMRDENGDTYLHRAARNGRSVAVIALVANRAESQRNNAGKTPYDVAQGLTLEASGLLEQCAESNVLK